MPGHEEHCQHSLKRYGVRGDDIHSWIDEPSTIAGASHRSFRHDLSSLPIAIQIFGSKYGADMVENIFLDHLKADSEENRRKETEKSYTEKVDDTIWTFPIPSFDCTVSGLASYLESSTRSVPMSPRVLVNSVKRHINYHPYYEIDYSVDQKFRTSVGQIHHEFANHKRVLLQQSEANKILKPEVAVFLNLRDEVPFEEPHEDSDGPPASYEGTIPRENALRVIKALHSKPITYSARGNSRVYKKLCEISERNIQINSFHLVYLPIIKLDFKIMRTPYAIDTVQKLNGEILRTDNKDIRGSCICNTCGKLFYEGSSVETLQGFSCSKCGQTTCRENGHWRRKHLFFKEFVCPKCYEEGKNSGIYYSEFSRR